MLVATRLTSREFRLAARPVGEPRPSDLDLVATEVPDLVDGQVLVRNTWMSVDPYMRGRMDDVPSYIAPFALGEPLEGEAVGEVVASRADDVPVGATVTHFLGWREYAVLDAAAATVIDTALAPPQAYLGALGTPGLTAYATLTETTPVREGDVVLVSAAAGAVGSVAGQLARVLGASRVIGIAGGPHKVEKVRSEFGFDAAIDHRAGPIAAQLPTVAPDGIDLYVDHVGGEHLEAAISALRVGGRAALVGAIGEYNSPEPPPGPRNTYDIVKKRLTLRGILVPDHLDLLSTWIPLAAGLLADGRLRTLETVVDGLESAPEALIGVLRGANTGKMLVRLV